MLPDGSEQSTWCEKGGGHLIKMGSMESVSAQPSRSKVPVLHSHRAVEWLQDWFWL